MFYKKMGLDVELYFLLYLMRFSYCSSNIFDRTILVSLKKKEFGKRNFGRKIWLNMCLKYR
jgi:hypothetical protein